MARSGDKDSGEKFQIALLTLGMTAGGFALVSLVFVLFMNPSARNRAEAAEREYKALATLLGSQEMHELRATAKRSAGHDNTKTLTDIVFETLSPYGLEYKSIKSAKIKSIKPGLDEVTQPIVLQPAPLVAILQYIVTVEHSKKTFQVLSLSLARDKRSGSDSDLWTANVEFRDYATK